MASKEKLFQKKINSLMKQAGNMEEDGVRRVVKLLSDARKEVAATVASTDWQIYYLPQMKAAVERALTVFGDKYGVQMRDMQREFWDAGIELVDLPLREVGVLVSIPEIDTTMISILQGYSTDLVEGLTKSAIKKINTELTLGLMGQKSPYEVMQAVGRNLKDKGIFKSITARADTILRTEAGRIYEAAGQLRKEAAASVVLGLKKQWHYGHSPKMPRLDHMAAHGQIREVNEPFKVGGEELMYPRDPKGSAKNTINCGCTSIPYHEDWESAAEQAMAA